MKSVDLAIIGGGFFGCSLALKYKNNYKNILILEKESDLLQRASFNNQARVHNGYHYPRSLLTAYRSSVNFSRFKKDYKEAVYEEFDKYYAVASTNSKVNRFQFYEIFKRMGAPIKPAEKKITQLFRDEMIDGVFKVKEVAFNAEILKLSLIKKLEENHILVQYNSSVHHIEKIDGTMHIHLENGEEIKCQKIINCSYSNINTILKNSGHQLLPLKHEITELCLVEPPEEIKNLGITIMDGPFFSVMPFPAKRLHSFSHVSYTPHGSWTDQEAYLNPEEILKNYSKKTNFPRMWRDAIRYCPILKECKYQHSLFEVKTILTQNEVDDGRPILYRQNYHIDDYSVIMGGKIDNIYDILFEINQAEKKDKLCQLK